MEVTDEELQKAVADVELVGCKHYPEVCECSYADVARELLALRKLARAVEAGEFHLYPELRDAYAGWRDSTRPQ